MKSSLLKMIGGTVLAFMVILVLTFGFVFAQDESKSAEGGGFDGTWNVQVTIRNCQNNAAIRSFASLTTFMSGGTLLDSTSGIPQALKTPGHGVWSHTGGREYKFSFKSFSFDANGNFTGWSIVRQFAVLNQRAGDYESFGTSEVYAPNGNLLFTGCSATTATRFE